MCGVLRFGSLTVLVFSLVLQVWIGYGHFYRTPFQDQFVLWFDGVNWNQVDPGFPESRDPKRDRFSMELYENVRSVEDAVRHVDQVAGQGSEEERLNATFDLVSERFIHHMYPHHTWATNPIYAALEFIDEKRSLNEMATADELLRHSAAGACGDTSVTFIEIWRAMGGEAQYVQLDGHHIVEAKAGGREWLVDADKDALAPYSIEHISRQPELVDEIYTTRPERDRGNLKEMFSREIRFSGYDGVPYYGARIYYLHKTVETAKWLIAPLGVVFALLGLYAHSRRCGKRPQRLAEST